MLQANNISYHVGGKALLQNVSVSFLPGQLNLIIGPNGAGKSTLIKALCQQLKPQQGTVTYNGINANNIALTEMAKIRAVLSQNIDLAFPMTVSEVVMMGRYPHFEGAPSEKDITACREAMDFFDVAAMAQRDYMSLSGGEKQRVHFARVVAQVWYAQPNQCRYLLLDEPLTFLDVYYQYQFMHKITELLKGSGLVVIGVVHDLNLAAKFAHHIVLLNKSTLLASGSASEVLTEQHIKEAYHLQPVIYRQGERSHIFFE